MYVWNRASFLKGEDESMISFIPNVYQARSDAFAKVAEGYVTIDINRYKEGIKLKHRLDLSAVEYLKAKILLAEPGFSYQENGITISKETARSWIIRITAEKNMGNRECTFRISEKEFYATLKDCSEYVSLYKQQLVLKQNFIDEMMEAMNAPREKTYQLEVRVLDANETRILAQMDDAQGDPGKPFTIYLPKQLQGKRFVQGEKRSLCVAVRNKKAVMISA